MFGYGSLTVQNLFEEMRNRSTHIIETVIETAVSSGMSTSSPFQILEAQLLLVQLLQLMGLGMAVSGTIMLAHGLWIKKENK